MIAQDLRRNWRRSCAVPSCRPSPATKTCSTVLPGTAPSCRPSPATKTCSTILPGTAPSCRPSPATKTCSTVLPGTAPSCRPSPATKTCSTVLPGTAPSCRLWRLLLLPILRRRNIGNMTKKGPQGPNRKRWIIHCWQCGKEFLASRETAMLCSAKCKMARHRQVKAGLHPLRHVLSRMFPRRKEGFR
jgi:hypothetical protein